MVQNNEHENVITMTLKNEQYESLAQLLEYKFPVSQEQLQNIAKILNPIHEENVYTHDDSNEKETKKEKNEKGNIASNEEKSDMEFGLSDVSDESFIMKRNAFETDIISVDDMDREVNAIFLVKTIQMPHHLHMILTSQWMKVILHNITLASTMYNHITYNKL